MKRILSIFILSICLPSLAYAEEGSSSTSGFANKLGVDVGLGFPYLAQAGVTYRVNEMFSVVAGYHLLDIDVDEASAELSMPAILVHYYPFSGSFFLGAGVGKQNLEVSATESDSNTKITAESDATTTIAQLGWTWGASNGGFWFGFDISYIMPSGADSSISPSSGAITSDPNYQDVQKALDDFGDTSYPNITFARLGWLF